MAKTLRGLQSIFGDDRVVYLPLICRNEQVDVSLIRYAEVDTLIISTNEGYGTFRQVIVPLDQFYLRVYFFFFPAPNCRFVSQLGNIVDDSCLFDIDRCDLYDQQRHYAE